MTRDPKDLSIPELERLLAEKRKTARTERMRQFGKSGRAVFSEPVLPQSATMSGTTPAASKRRAILDRALLAVEILAAVGLAFILLQGARIIQDLNREVSASILAGTPSPTPLIRAVVLPSGHLPPGSPGGAAPNESEIPAHLRPQMQAALAVAIPTRGPEQPIRLDLPAIGLYNLPIVEGDGWEQLKQGVGHHIGSANPGPSGNVVLSAHNDIFGELFRDLDKLQPGDEIIVYTATQKFRYAVVAIRIVEPTDTDILKPANRPTLTLISCYPYLVDNMRIVVIADQLTSL